MPRRMKEDYTRANRACPCAPSCPPPRNLTEHSLLACTVLISLSLPALVFGGFMFSETHDFQTRHAAIAQFKTAVDNWNAFEVVKIAETANITLALRLRDGTDPALTSPAAQFFTLWHVYQLNASIGGGEQWNDDLTFDAGGVQVPTYTSAKFEAARLPAKFAESRFEPQQVYDALVTFPSNNFSFAITPFFLSSSGDCWTLATLCLRVNITRDAWIFAGGCRSAGRRDVHEYFEASSCTDVFCFEKVGIEIRINAPAQDPYLALMDLTGDSLRFPTSKMKARKLSQAYMIAGACCFLVGGSWLCVVPTTATFFAWQRAKTQQQRVSEPLSC